MNLREQLHKTRYGPICNLSNSKSSTEATTNNIDQRLAQESGAFGATASGGGVINTTSKEFNLQSGALAASANGGSVVNITALDPGSIAASFGLANNALDRVTTLASGSQSAAAHTAELALNGALSSVAGARDAYDSARQELAKAYEDAKIGARGALNQTVIIAGLAVVGLVAFMAMKKG